MSNNTTLQIHDLIDDQKIQSYQNTPPNIQIENDHTMNDNHGFGEKDDTTDDKTMRKTIVSKYLEPFFLDQLQHDIKWRPIWSDSGHFFDVAHKIVYVSTSAIAFASATYESQSLAFLSGSIGILAAAMSTFSTFCFRKAREKTRSINIVLDKFDLHNIPDIVADNDAQDTIAPNVPKKAPFPIQIQSNIVK